MLQIPHYKLKKLLHRGKDNLIFRGSNEKNFSVIVKLLDIDYPSSLELTKFRQEYELTKLLSTSFPKQIPAPIDFVKYQNTYAIVFEDEGGQPLELFLKSHPPLSLPQFFKLAIAVTKILEQIHSLNIIHKDINPSNILVNPDFSLVQIIDFGLSSTVSLESPHLSLQNLEGTLNYISPEQTGRMNRLVDYRSDYYSLGMTFYETLTGRLPFEEKTLLELVYAHLAKAPPPPHFLKSSIPLPLSNLVLKLLSKTPEERYQSTFGLLQDLEKCQKFYLEEGNIPFFELAQADISSIFQIPKKLYGRELYLEQFHAFYKKNINQRVSASLLSGSPGVGKTSLIKEINHPNFIDNGLFTYGKCHLFEQNIPYGPIIEGIKSIIQQIQNDLPLEVENWQHRLKKALGMNGKIMLDLIPELKSIIGPQPEISEISLGDNSRRFSYVFKTFIQSLASEYRPLVMALDDLQWVDPSTIEILIELLTDSQTKFIHFILAYRTSEIDELHRIKSFIRDLESKGIPFEHLNLPLLTEEQTNSLISDTLHRTKFETKNLSLQIYQKTKGSPFFLNQMLDRLYKKNHIFFDHKKGQWDWKQDLIEDKEISDNVIEFMTNKVLDLPAYTYEVLRLAACFGSSFELDALARLCDQSPADVAKILLKALEEGLIYPENENYRFVELTDESITYKFLHDRIQQALYVLISSAERENVHYKIGKILIKKYLEADSDKHLFDIANHLNRGRSQIKDKKEQVYIANLNFLAGQKAKSAAAFNSANNYLKNAYELLPSTQWEEDPQFVYKILTEWVSCLYVTGAFEQAGLKIDELLSHSHSTLEKAQILNSQAMIYTTIHKMEEGLAITLKGLQLLGISLSPNPGYFAYIKEFVKAKWNLNNRTLSKISKAGKISDPYKSNALELLHQAVIGNYFSGHPLLTGVLVLKQINLISQYGHSRYSSLAFINYAIMLNAMGQQKMALKLGKLALELSEKFSDEATKQRTIITYAHFIHSWNYPWKELKQICLNAVDKGLQTGDLTSLLMGATYALLWDPEETLDTLALESPKYLELIKSINYQNAYDVAKLLFQSRLNLSGKTFNSASLSDQSFDEYEALESFQKSKFTSGIMVYALCKLFIAYHFEDYQRGKSYLDLGDQYLESLYGTTLYADYCFYAFLLNASLYSDLEKEKRLSLKRMKKELKKFDQWSDNCPANFLNYKLLMEAEMARILGHVEKAISFYDQAIKNAQDHGFTKNLALANELAAKFYFGLNKIKLGKAYLFDACYYYQKWGANSKVKQLEESFHNWIPKEFLSLEGFKEITTLNSSSIQNSSRLLDIMSILKASQTITRETSFNNLIPQMMKIVIENAGAEVGYLIFEKEGDYFIEAKANDQKINLLPSLPVTQLPVSLIKYVAINKQPIILGNAFSEGNFKNDPYIRKNQTKSVLCFPLINFGVVKGMLYLENNLVRDVFTRKHLDVLSLLSTQIAISIDNTRFYTQLEKRIQDETKSLRKAQQLLIQKEKMAFLGMLTTGIAHEIKNPLNFIINFSHLSEDILFEIEQIAMNKNIVNKTVVSQLVHEMLKKIHLINEQGHRADAILNRLIEHSAEQSQNFTDTDLHQLIELTFNQFQENKKTESRVEYRKNYHSYPLYVSIAEGDFQRVLFNLLDNSYKAIAARIAQEGDAFHPYIEIKTIDKDSSCEIHILDNGIGIPSELRNNIFKPFLSHSNQNRLGLGLALSYNIIVDEHGGMLSFVSQPNERTEFVISLPRRAILAPPS